MSNRMHDIDPGDFVKVKVGYEYSHQYGQVVDVQGDDITVQISRDEIETFPSKALTPHPYSPSK